MPPMADLKVLIVEDNVVNQYLLSKILKDWKIEIDVADNGRKALEIFEANDFDLILMDTHMPEMNGYETAKMIRTTFSEPKRSIPIISLSAASFEHEQQEAIDAGMNDVLTKPFQARDLHSKMQNLLNIVQ
jgi:CheY-like chemotaxis protein